MTNPTKLLRSLFSEIPFNYEIDWNDSLKHQFSNPERTSPPTPL
ncbi:hypothetical protein [uncultured Nostoc sp.]